MPSLRALPFAVSAAVVFASAAAPAQAAGDELPARLQAALAAAHESTGVPAVTAAIARGDRIIWAGAAGVRRRSGAAEGGPQDQAVDAQTRFQAASISKPITALAVMRLLAEGACKLDDPIAGVARADGVGDEPVTLRRLLSHTAGMTVHGFPGYAKGSKVPDLAKVLAGEGNTDAIEVDTAPGSAFRYSGGGYCHIQRWLVAHREQPFAQLMRELVLAPIGMKHSTFVQPLPEALFDQAACAHGRDGQPIDVVWHVYPEQAAAGLWTTASDLVRALLAVDRARAGSEGALLPVEVAREMLTVQKPSDRFGLGLMVRGDGERLMFGHSGGNRGFLCDARLLREGDDVTAYAVMINSEQRDALGKIVAALMRTVRPK